MDTRDKKYYLIVPMLCLTSLSCAAKNDASKQRLESSIASENIENECHLNIGKENIALQALQTKEILQRHFKKQTDGSLVPNRVNIKVMRQVVSADGQIENKHTEVSVATITLDTLVFLNIESAHCENNHPVYKFAPAPVPSGIQMLIQLLEPAEISKQITDA